MSYHQFFLTDERAISLRESVSAYQHIEDTHLTRHSPFTREKVHQRIARHLKRGFVALAEALLRVPLYAENTLGELRVLSPPVRNMLTELHKRGLIESWHYSYLAPDQPKIHSLSIKPTPLKMPSGRTFVMRGSTGAGTGFSLEEAALPALGEFVERLAISTWSHRTDFLHESAQALKVNGKSAIPLNKLQFFSDEQLEDERLKRSVVTEKTELTWIPANVLRDSTQVFVPAAVAYMFYTADNLDEPVFWDVNSNGAAAHTSYEEATYRALCELIERDAFLRAWYHKRTPMRVSLESIEQSIPEVAPLLERIHAYNAEMYFLDITSDIRVPTFCAVRIDRKGDIAVSVSAATDICAKVAMANLVRESMKFAHGATDKTPRNTSRLRVRNAGKGGVIRTLEDRYTLWTYRRMVREMEWFLQGKEVDFSTLESGFNVNVNIPTTSVEKVTHVQRLLSEKHYEIYVVDVSTPDSKEFGLNVVRCISPDLVPMFFDERGIYLNSPRLCDRKHSKDDLNSVPHPFV